MLLKVVRNQTKSKAVNEINNEENVLTEKLKINHRVQCIAQNEAFIKIKDHKPNFSKNVACRLLNPWKSEIGKIIKLYIENIKNLIRSSNNLNQWRNSKPVIDWFKMIPLKKQSHFIQVDIVSFYPSIGRNVLNEKIKFARNYHNINNDMINTLMNSRKVFLFYDGSPWVKKDTLQHLDVTEGRFDGT